MRKQCLSLLTAAALCLQLCACAAPAAGASASAPAAQSASASAGQEGFSFTDDIGRTVELAAQPERIVPAAPLAQIILFAVAPDKLAGLSSEWYDSARGIIGEQYFELPVFGGLYASADLNVEELAAVQPDLIIDIGEEKDSSVDDLDRLQQQTGIPTVYISADLASMPETFRTLGALLGEEEQAEKLASFCERVYQRTLSIMEQVGDDKADALYVIGDKGLNVLAKGSYHAELLDLLTNNLAVVDTPLSKGTGNEVSMEQISLWDPSFVIFAPDSIYDTVKQDPSWSQIDAIVHDNYVRVPDAPHNWMSMPPSVQRYLGLIWLPAVLYPEYCDYDPEEEIREYYELFYHCELTQEQYRQITDGAFLE